MRYKFVLFIATIFFALLHLFVEADEKSYNTIVSELKEFKVKNNRVPTEKDLFTLAHDLECNLTPQEVQQLYQVVISLHSPIITKEQLGKLFSAKINSIRDYRCDYTLHQTSNVLSTNENNSTLSFEYAQKGCMRLIDISGYDNKDIPSLRKSFDGNKVIEYISPNDVLPTASIMNLEKLTAFIPDGLPLATAMLLDMSILGDNDSVLRNYNLLMFLKDPEVLVHEENYIINGLECVLVGNQYSHVFLDKALDFSVVKIIHYRLAPSNERNDAPWEKKPSIETTLSDFIEFDNGIFLPATIEQIYYDIERKNSDNISTKSVVKVSNMTINSGIKDEFFTDFIPNDTIVADRSKDIVYKYGDRASIGGLLKETVQRKTVNIFRWISVFAGLIMIGFGVGFKIRQRMLNGRSL